MKVVVSNVFGPLNRGDHELFGALLRLLHERDFRVEAVARDPQLCHDTFPSVVFHEQPGKADRGPLLLQRFLRMLRLAIAVVSPWAPGLTRLLPRIQRDAVVSLLRADLVIACPGGYLEDSRLSLYPQLVQLWVAALTHGRLVLAPMSIGPIRGRLPRWMLRRILANAERIFVREAISDNFCRDLGFSATQSNDLAFLNEHFRTSIPETDTTPAHIAVTAIKWSFPGRDRDMAQRQYVASLVAAISNIAMHVNLPVKLIVQVENDMDMIRQVANKLTVPTEIVHDVNTPEKIQAFLQQSYCLVASRFHSAIFALAVGCPVAALAYLPKTTGMLTLYGMDDLCFPIEGFDAENLSATLIRWGDDRSGFRQRCVTMRDNLRQVGDPFIDYLDAAGKSATANTETLIS